MAIVGFFAAVFATIDTTNAAGFIAAAPLAPARITDTATRLPSGKVLLTGGAYSARTDMYDPASDSWSQMASLGEGRAGASATSLESGLVLVVGGSNNAGVYLTSGELYDPATNAWSPSTPMAGARSGHTATRLSSGKVLVAGGWRVSNAMQAQAELYDPNTDTWTSAGTPAAPRSDHTATLLQSGKVLVAGGHDINGKMASAELYDPATNSWSSAGSLTEARSLHTATLLDSGRVLVTGGDTFFGRISSTEIYDPLTNQWLGSAPLATARDVHTATLLPSGKVLVVGGYDFPNVIGTAELYDPDSGTWIPAGTLLTPRLVHVAVPLESGRVLVASGRSVSGPLASVELYAPETTIVVSTPPVATVVGEPYVVSVAVSGVSGTPTGSVTVSDGQGSSCGPVVLSNGAGSCTLPSTEAGGFVLTATYAPDTGAFTPSSATAHHAVNRADTSLAIVGHAPKRSIPGQAVAVSAALVVVSPGAGTPTGPVTIGDGVDACTIPQGDTACSLSMTIRGLRTLTASYAGDGNFNASSAQAPHHVNQLPLVPAAATFVTNADVPLLVPAAQGLLAQASDPDGDALAIANAGPLTAGGIGGTVLLQADGAFAYTPPAYAHGLATFDYAVSDGYETVAATATITVNFVNHAPRFALAATPKWPAGSSGVKTQAGFATVTDFGAPNETDQSVLAWHLRTIDDADGVVSNVAIALDGTLTYTLNGNAGRATFGVTLQDDGGTANGGSDSSGEQTFTISVAAGLDLSIHIDNDSDFVVGGAPVEYTIVVRNAGPDAAFGARVRDALPFNLVDAAWSCAASPGASCTPAGSGDIDDAVTLAAGATLTYTLIATVVADPETTIEHVVSVSAPDGVPDLDPGNNSATRRNTVGVFFDGFDREAPALSEERLHVLHE